MREFLIKLFNSDFMPHGYCYLWNPGIVWLHALSDGLIAASYYFIPVMLVYLVRRRRDLPFHWMFFMFGLFILGCGTTHAMEVWTLWHGTYRLAGVIKAITAGTSLATAALLIPLVPRALALPSPAQMRAVNLELEQEINQRRQTEEALQVAHAELELRVQQRTAELARANQELRTEIAERKRAEAESLRLKDELVAELAAMTRLHKFSTRLLANHELQPLLEEVLNATIALQSADFGNVQLYNPETRALEIVAQRGFRQDFLDHFSSVRESGSACGQALQRGERVIIEDVQTDPGFEPYRPIAASAGFRAVQSTPMFSRSGEPLGMISTHFRQPHRPSEHDLRVTDVYARQAADMIERKRSEERLQTAQAQLAHMARVTTMGELAASIAHEVNQPLTAVVTNGNACLRWLAGAPPNLQEARDAVTRIVKEGNRASEVIARIRSFMKKSAPQKAQVRMNELIGEVVALTRHEFLRRDVSLRAELAADVPDVAGDRVQLQQIMLNLIMNGIEATSMTSEGPREILITSEREKPDEVLIAVRDSGTGIDPRNLDRLFDPFFTTKPDGMGMGLSICRSIIEAHGGRLWATANEHRGASFTFSLPASNGSLDA